MFKQTKQEQPKIIEYTIQNYRNNFNQLMTYAKRIDQNTKQLILEKIELISEFSVWGDSNNSDFFEQSFNRFSFFFEQSIAEQLFKIMQRSPYKEINLVVIQSFSILLANLGNKDNVTYLLSHPVMNDIISYNYDFTDDETVEYYISMLKSISLRLDETNITLFFNQRLPHFPLLWQAMRFYNYKEVMIKTAVRSIILHIMKLQNETLKAYLTRFPFVIFYAHFVCYLKNIWLELNTDIIKLVKDIKDRIDDQLDLFFFLTDMYANCPEASEIIDNALLVYGLLPAVFGGILYQRTNTLAIPLSLHLLNHFILRFNNSSLSNNLTVLLFSPYIQSKLNLLIETNVRQPKSFMYQWSFKHYWDNHQDYINHQASRLFNQDVNVDLNEDCKEEIRMINDVLGLKGAIGVSYCCKQLLNNNNNGELVENKIRQQLMIYLQTKDDNFLYLLLNLWKNILTTKSPDILRVCLFGTANTTGIIQERNYIIKNLLMVFTIDPPLRLCTFILVSQVINYFLKIDKLPLLEDTQQQLYDSYQYIVKKLSEMIKQQQYKDILISQFMIAKQYRDDIMSFKPELNYLAFQPIIDQYDPNIDLMYRNPVSLKEKSHRDLAVFLMLDNIIHLTLNSPIHIDQINPTNEWVIGRNYEPDQKRMLPCRICAKTIREKLQPYKSGECFWIEDEENFIIVETQIVKRDWAHVLHNHKLNDIEVIIDRAEPRILTVSIKLSQQSLKEQYVDIQLYFDDLRNILMIRGRILLNNQLQNQKI
ncbi:hypothetical protein pb186bvf_018248 [Paramecium bursaria]